MKKIYNAPYLKVVSVSNDIIATSGMDTLNNGIGYGTTKGFVPRRGENIWSDGSAVEDEFNF